jgi:hypothetical protein
MSPRPSHRSKRKRQPAKTPPPEENVDAVATAGPQFAEPSATADPTQFRVKHGSDTKAYSILDSQKGLLEPRPFPVVEGVPQPPPNKADEAASFCLAEEFCFDYRNFSLN